MPNRLSDGSGRPPEGLRHSPLQERFDSSTHVLRTLVRARLRACQVQLQELAGSLFDLSRSVETGDERCLLIVGTHRGLAEIEFSVLRLTGWLGVRTRRPGAPKERFHFIQCDGLRIDAAVSAFAVDTVRALREQA